MLEKQRLIKFVELANKVFKEKGFCRVGDLSQGLWSEFSDDDQPYFNLPVWKESPELHKTVVTVELDYFLPDI